MLRPALYTACLVVGVLSSDALAQTAPQVLDGRQVQKPWSQLVGRRVAAEGLAWGAVEKGLGPYLVLPHGRVHVANFDSLQAGAEGKLVRMTGVLRVKRAPRAAPGAAGFDREFDYYSIDAEQWRIVDRVELPGLMEAPADPVAVPLRRGMQSRER
ncbi:MAG: hypothetical protein WD069_18815 [Planctomycetales bacterium]